MKIKQHMSIGKIVLGNDTFSKFKINKRAYLLGTIAPDINCVYPAHSIESTEKRFCRRLRLVKRINSNIIKSFILGIITHYICDYFCFPHNIGAVGAKHKKYEKILYKYYLSNLNKEENNKNILEDWIEYKDKNIKKYISSDKLSIDNYCKLIISQIKNMNDKYRRNAVTNKKDNWSERIEQIDTDIQYSTFMAKHMLKLVMQY